MLGRMYDQNCSVARTLELVGERWTFLIIRDALRGACRFDTFLTRLGIARNVLTDRLNRLVENGIFDRVPYQDRPVRHEYHLTAKGRDLWPVIMTLMEWGDRHLPTEAGPPVTMEHAACGGHAASQVICEACARPLSVTEVTARSNTPEPLPTA